MSGKKVTLSWSAVRAVVTGGCSGIGRATASQLVQCGATVAVIDRAKTGAPVGVSLLRADIRDSAAVDSAVDTAAQVMGGISLLVNVVGVSATGTIEDGDLADWASVFDVNVLGLVRVTRAALPYLRRAVGASIVNISSCVAVNGLPDRALYSASKGAVHSLTLAMAADLVTEGIRVNAVVPATVDTEFMTELAARASDPVAQRRAHELRQPTGRMVVPDEVARAVAYLADPGSLSSTGSTLTVDGGMHTLRLPVHVDVAEPPPLASRA
jgi:2-keto-3-deoxy-L-fuconate dehydrogenase